MPFARLLLKRSDASRPVDRFAISRLTDAGNKPRQKSCADKGSSRMTLTEKQEAKIAEFE